MPTTMRYLLPALLVALSASNAVAQEPIRFSRTPDVSPDGKTIAFSYLGDIYAAETIGGTARPVTSHPAHDINPVFSPDGQTIAFSSNRHGSYDVFTVPLRGGRPKRLTFDSSPDMVCGWTPDGKGVLFASTSAVTYPPSVDLYVVPAEGGRPKRITVAEGKEGTFSPSGAHLAYTRGPGSWYRKGYRGSSNDDIWVCKADGTDNRRLTTFNGQDHSPMWSADGSTMFYVSEEFGMANVVKVSVAPLLASAAGSPTQPLKPVQVTTHVDEAVRRARISRNGEWIVYECGGDMWTVSTAEGAKARKIAVEVNADDKANNERVETFTRGITEFAMNADEKFAVVALKGKLFRVQVGSTPKVTQMTFGASNDHGAVWSPDGTKLLFVSDRNGHDDLYSLEADDVDHPKLIDAHRFKASQLTDSRDAEFGVTFSPDGKKVAFLRGGKLWTMNPDGKEPKAVLDEPAVFDYEWSPDSRWFVFARRDGSFASELYIAPSTGPTVSNPVRNITRYATYNAGVTWSADGKVLAFLSDRRNSANLHTLELEKPAVETSGGGSKPSTWGWGGKAPLTIDFDDIHLRAKPVIRGPVEEAAISPDGSKVAFRDGPSRDLWIGSASGSSLTRVTTGGVSPRQIVWSKKRGGLLGGSLDVLYFIDGQGQLRLCNATGGSSGSSSALSSAAATDRSVPLLLKVKMTVKQDEMFGEMFDQGWRFLSENFYDDKYHGRDWNDVRRRYRPLVKHITMKEDLYALLYLVMGELNASHLGVSGFISSPEEETAELGLLFDNAYVGRGFKVAEILKRGPADKKGIGVKPGDVVVAIDDAEISDKTDLARLLNGRIDETVVLTVVDNALDPKAKRRRVEVKAMSRYGSRANPTGVSDLMYDRWVAKNAAKVTELSGGKLGYIHIPSMDEEGLDAFVRSLYSDNYDKEAIVLDVRFNGGGFTHDQVLNYLGSKEHTVFKNRDGGTGLVLRAGDRKWHKPLALLINNRSYSDAEIFPNAFKTLGLGKVVGEPTGGFVIGTTSLRLVDGSQFRIPRIGVYTLKGVNMDKEGVQPDILVENTPDVLARGGDLQIEKAVEALKADVVAWKKSRQPTVVVSPIPAPTTKPPVPVTTPAGTPAVPMGGGK